MVLGSGCVPTLNAIVRIFILAFIRELHNIMILRKLYCILFCLNSGSF